MISWRLVKNRKGSNYAPGDVPSAISRPLGAITVGGVRGCQAGVPPPPLPETLTLFYTPKSCGAPKNFEAL
jgi:hypothetical protein